MKELQRITTVVFDIGNVVVRWDPAALVLETFGAGADLDTLRQSIFSQDIWRSLNLGRLTVAEAKSAYLRDRIMTVTEADRLFEVIIANMTPLPGTVPLMESLRRAGYRLLALTDNVHEFVDHYKANHSWWAHLDGAVVSAELGIMKPNLAIYDALRTHWGVTLSEAVFMDDVFANAEGAIAAGLHAFQFTTAEDASRRLKSDYGLHF